MTSYSNRTANFIQNPTVHVPESQHSIFIRGFPGDMELNRVRDFFESVAGHCTFDFFKQSPDKLRLFVAIRFDSRDVARDVMDRYNNCDVLGYPMQMTWFKDIRRFAAYAGNGTSGPPIRGSMNPRMPYTSSRGYSSSSRGYYSTRGPRMGGYIPSSSRSNGYYDSTHRLKSRVRSHAIGMPRINYTSHARSRSSSYSRSYSSEDRRSHSSKSRSSRSPSKSPERSRPSRSKRSPVVPPPAIVKKEPSHSPARPSKKKMMSPKKEASPSLASKQDQALRDNRTLIESDSDPCAKRVRIRVSNSPPVVSRKRQTSETSSAILNNDQAKRQHLKNLRKQLAMDTSDEDKTTLRLLTRDSNSPPTPKRPPPDSSDTDEKSSMFRQKKTPALDKGNSSSDALVISASPNLMDTCVDRGQRQFQSSTDPLPASYRDTTPKAGRYSRPRRSSSSSSDDHNNGVHIRKMNGGSSLFNGFGESLNDSSKKNRDREVSLSNELITIQNSTVADLINAEKRKQEVQQAQQPKKPKKHKKKDKNELKLSSVTKEATADTDRQKKISSMPPEKLQLLQSKRKELEQAYKQDCETFATVVKMLISKDASLEDKLLNSLRESLKDIGQKFISELNQFVDTLVTAD